MVAFDKNIPLYRLLSRVIFLYLNSKKKIDHGAQKPEMPSAPNLLTSHSAKYQISAKKVG
jgi:hypothetical protein